MFVGVVIGCLALVVVFLAAQRAPQAVLDRRSSRVGPDGQERVPPAVWKGQDLGLPRTGRNSLAEVGRRMWGILIDGLVLAPVIVAGALARHTRVTRYVDPVTGISHLRLVSSHPSVIVSLALLAPSGVYTVVLIAIRGQTLGQKALGLRVARRLDGSIPGWSVSARRWALPGATALMGVAVPALAPLLVVVGVVDLLWALWDPNRRCLHDLIADTLVVNTS